MMSTLIQVAMPPTKDLIVANCSHPGVAASLMWADPTRLDQTQTSASDYSRDVQRIRGTWKSHSSDDGGAWNWNDWTSARSEEDEANEWPCTAEGNQHLSKVPSFAK